METLEELKRRLEEERPMTWESFPDIGLYMDQVVSYVERQLISFGNDRLTPAMVNNYIKDGLLPRADGKKYSRTHLAYLTEISALKQVLTVREMRTLLSAGAEVMDAEDMYATFGAELSQALTETAGDLQSAATPDELHRLALHLALRSYANRLACERVLAMLAPPEPEKKKGAEKHGKKKAT